MEIKAIRRNRKGAGISPGSLKAAKLTL